MEINIAAKTFSALAQDTRLSALKLLIDAGPIGLAAGELAEKAHASPSSLTFHMKELVAANLIHSRREGRKIFYSADYGGLRDLIDFLMADCCQGDPRLCGPYIIKETTEANPAP